MKLTDVICKQIIKEVRLNDVVFSYGGRAVVDTNHATSRFMERTRGIISPDDLYEVLFVQMIKRIVRMDEKNKVPAEEILVYSKKLNQAIVVAYRYDKFDRQDLNKNFYIITYLPPGKKTPKDNRTPVIIVERHNHAVLKCSPELESYLISIIQSSNVKLNESTVGYDYNPINLVDGLDYKIILKQNKLYDVDLPIIEID